VLDRTLTCEVERNFDIALEEAALVVRPDEKPFSWNVDEDCKTGWWLMKHLEEAGFGKEIQIKRVNGRIEAPTLDDLVANMMLFKDSRFFGLKTDVYSCANLLFSVLQGI